MTFDSQHVENILAVFHGGPWNVESGLSWYARAHDFAQSLDSEVARAAAVVAVLSPNTSWNANKTLALKAYAQRTGAGMGFPDKVSKVNRLFSGECPHAVVKGPKVTQFFRSILDPMGENIAVVDRHAQDIADGIRNTDKTRKPPSGKRYTAYAEAYAEAARMVGLPIHALQAITWETWREAHSINV